MFKKPQLTLTDFNNHKLSDIPSQAKIPLPQLIKDIETGNHYPFSIKPEDEDKQTYYPQKKGKWSMIAYCCLQRGSTDQLLKRLKGKAPNIFAQREA